MGEYEASGDKMFTKHGINDTKETLKFYGKALSAAEEKGLLGKVPPLLLKMGICHRILSETETEVATKLASIGVWSTICHWQNSTLSMYVMEIFIFELFTIDWLTSSPISTSEIPTLSHKTRNHTMEDAALVVQWLARLSNAFLSSAESTEIFWSLRRIQWKFYHDAPSTFSSNCYIEKYLGHFILFLLNNYNILNKN